MRPSRPSDPVGIVAGTGTFRFTLDAPRETRVDEYWGVLGTDARDFGLDRDEVGIVVTDGHPALGAPHTADEFDRRAFDADDRPTPLPVLDVEALDPGELFDSSEGDLS
jgi:hypothetical protein